MIATVGGVVIEPFFLPAPRGERFCIFHPAQGTPRGGILYVHPFAEEMNKARRMAALQSRAFAAAGYTVLQMDLLGCGDSSGDFVDASWEAWQQDVAVAVRWLSERITGAVTLWGLRLGALLALDAARHCNPAPTRFLLWQPVVSGEMMLTQFLRLRVTGEMLSAGSATTSVKDLRAQLTSGESIEVAGYTLSPRLASAIDGLKLAGLKPLAGDVYWLEVGAESSQVLSPATQRVVELWNASGIMRHVACVSGQSFWNTVETSECLALIAATIENFGAGAE